MAGTPLDPLDQGRSQGLALEPPDRSLPPCQPDTGYGRRGARHGLRRKSVRFAPPAQCGYLSHIRAAA